MAWNVTDIVADLLVVAAVAVSVLLVLPTAPNVPVTELPETETLAGNPVPENVTARLAADVADNACVTLLNS